MSRKQTATHEYVDLKISQIPIPVITGFAPLSGAIFTGNISAPNLSGTNTGDQDLAPYALSTTVTSDITAHNASEFSHIDIRSKGDSTYTTVNANSATWGTGGTNLSYLSGRVDANTDDITLIGAASGSWNSAYTTVNSNSALWGETVDLSPYAMLSGAAFTGPITATNLSGTNTGDQDLSPYVLTITLTANYATNTFVASSVSSHNIDGSSHQDIRDSVTNLSNSLSSYWKNPDGIENIWGWTKDTTSVTLTSYNLAVGGPDVVIPDMLDGLPVTGLLAGDGLTPGIFNGYEDQNTFYIVPGMAITSVTGNLKSIPDYAFYSCIYLTSVNFPQATTVGDYAFSYCTALTTVSLPQATTIGEYAFSESGLLSLNLPQVKITGYASVNYCQYLASVSLPEATTIGEGTFEGCTALASVSLPQATTIGSAAFSGCTLLASVSLPQATTIGSAAFSGCTLLASISLPQATTIGDYAFSVCSVLETINLPQATTIGDLAFDGCADLVTIALPQATTIGDYAFNYCSLLTSVSLPQATAIGSVVFDGCGNLVSVTFAQNAPTGVDVFYGLTANQVTIYVTNPAATGWGPLWNDMPVVRLPLYSGDFTSTGSISASGNIFASNLSGTNTGDQNLAPYVLTTTLTANYATNTFVTSSISAHNIDGSSHQDIRDLIIGGVSLSSYATLSGANFNGNVFIPTLSTSSIILSGYNVYTHPKRIVLMDVDGDSFMVYLRGGILTVD